MMATARARYFFRNVDFLKVEMVNQSSFSRLKIVKFFTNKSLNQSKSNNFYVFFLFVKSLFSKKNLPLINHLYGLSYNSPTKMVLTKAYFLL